MTVVAISIAVLPSQADEIDALRSRVRAARTQDDFAEIYEKIEKKFDGETRPIVEHLENIGFSCQYGNILFKAKCEYAYCGDRSALFLFRRQLMTASVLITDSEVFTGVTHQPVACPSSDELVRDVQERLLAKGGGHDRKQ